MNTCWNLDPIYTGFNDPRFDVDLAALEQATDDFAAFTEALPELTPGEGLHRGILHLETLHNLFQRLNVYASLVQAADTTSTEASSRCGQVLAVYSAAAEPQAVLENWIAGLSGLDSLIDADPTLSDYRFLLHRIREGSRFLLSGRAEGMLARLSLSGSNAWSELQQVLTSTVEVRYRDRIIGLSEVRGMAEDPDPQVRKDAYEAELACYKAIETPVAYALNSIKLETLSDCKFRGHASALDRTLFLSDMKRETLDAMLGAIYEYLPKFRQYLKAKARALGHKNGLPWYDLCAPMGRVSARFTVEDARDRLVSVFTDFDPEVGGMIAEAFDHAWIDFYPRSGKSGGAFCQGVDCLNESRILTNFTGLPGDVVTLAHELGHAFHDRCVSGHKPLSRDYSMPLAETASIFNECVYLSAAIASATDDEERLALLESDLQGTTAIVVDILSRYLFETAVFEAREQQFMGPKELCALMLEAQEQSYGDGLDPNCRHPYMWLCKSHYYGETFYNFPYAFGGLFARGIYARYLQEGPTFLPRYKKLLTTTSVATAEDTALVLGIDLTDRSFWQGALQTVAEQIDLFCHLTKQD